jgi:hypothetical protein
MREKGNKKIELKNIMKIMLRIVLNLKNNKYEIYDINNFIFFFIFISR